MLSAGEDPAQTLTDRYDREAADYRELWAPTLRIAARRLLGEFARFPARRIVDVATGVGSLLPELRLAFPAARIVGIDRSRGMLDLAPREFPRAVMDATRLGFATASVDLVILAFVLFHLSEPLDGLREARRILDAGGQVGSITWAGELESTASRVWIECLDAHGALPADPVPIARHDAVDSPLKMDALLRNAGFGGVRCWEEELVDRFDAARLLRLKTSLGSAKPRFDSLEPSARESCLAEARRRMERLGPEDFVCRGRIVFSVGAT